MSITLKPRRRRAAPSTPTIAEYEIHPTADLFPMMEEEVLLDLAEDIKANGQYDDIVIDQHGRLIDGRNRHAACGIAKVQPTLTTIAFPDEDAIDRYIFAKNTKRRDLKKGQKAMIYACRWPGEPNRSGVVDRSDKLRISLGSSENGASAVRIRDARYVYHRNPGLAEEVRLGTTGLDIALIQVRKLEEDKKKRDDTYEQLKAKAPDIAGQIDDDNLPVKDAVLLYQARQKEAGDALNTAAAALRAIRSHIHNNAAGTVMMQFANGNLKREEVLLIVTEELIDDIVQYGVQLQTYRKQLKDT